MRDVRHVANEEIRHMAFLAPGAANCLRHEQRASNSPVSHTAVWRYQHRLRTTGIFCQLHACLQGIAPILATLDGLGRNRWLSVHARLSNYGLEHVTELAAALEREQPVQSCSIPCLRPRYRQDGRLDAVGRSCGFDLRGK